MGRIGPKAYRRELWALRGKRAGEERFGEEHTRTVLVIGAWELLSVRFGHWRERADLNALRLHDFGWSGVWTWLPPAAGIAAFAAARGLLFGNIFFGRWMDASAATVSAIIGFSVYAVLKTILSTVLHKVPSQKGPNGYGPEPGEDEWGMTTRAPSPFKVRL